MADTLSTLTDKLIIENMKQFRLREKFENDKTLTDQQKIDLFNLAETCNRQRNEICDELDKMIEDWFSGKSIPKTFKRIKA